MRADVMGIARKLRQTGFVIDAADAPTLVWAYPRDVALDFSRPGRR